jgi:hypothetical protein
MSKLNIQFKCKCDKSLKEKIIEMLSRDPRPANPECEDQKFESKIDTVDVQWEVHNGNINVLEIF